MLLQSIFIFSQYVQLHHGYVFTFSDSKIDYGDYPLKPPSNYKIYLDQVNLLDMEFVKKD